MKGTPLASQGQIDLFKQSFREEAREALVDLESALLELNNEPANRDLSTASFAVCTPSRAQAPCSVRSPGSIHARS